jgi:hypothetical protein
MADLDLAAIGNGPVASLIIPHGRHGWFRFPCLDAELILAAMCLSRSRKEVLWHA